jgi:hypothetical protein
MTETNIFQVNQRQAKIQIEMSLECYEKEMKATTNSTLQLAMKGFLFLLHFERD